MFGLSQHSFSRLSSLKSCICHFAPISTQFVHLEDRYSSFLHERVHLLNIGCVSVILTLHHDDFLTVNLHAQLHAVCNLCEASFAMLSSNSLCRLRVLASFLAQVSCQATHLPYSLTTCVMQQRCADEILDLPCLFEQPASPILFQRPQSHSLNEDAKVCGPSTLQLGALKQVLSCRSGHGRR